MCDLWRPYEFPPNMLMHVTPCLCSSVPSTNGSDVADVTSSVSQISRDELCLLAHTTREVAGIPHRAETALSFGIACARRCTYSSVSLCQMRSRPPSSPATMLVWFIANAVNPRVAELFFLNEQ